MLICGIIVKALENNSIFAVYFPFRCVVVLAGREPACVLRLAGRKISSQILALFSSALTIRRKANRHTVSEVAAESACGDDDKNRTFFVSASCLRIVLIAHKNLGGISKFFP